MKAITTTVRLAAACMAALLVGCGAGSDHADLKDFIRETKARPTGQIKPLPTFKPYESFVYSAMRLRSPFEPPAKEQKRFVSTNSNVKPDFAREKEYLEQYEFLELTMVGTVEQKGVLWALINDSEGVIHRVRRGNYLGKNHGKITTLSLDKIDVIEIVADGVDGWLERPRAISLKEQQ